MAIRLRVHGTPAPQGSKVRTKWGMREASTKVMPWREAVVSQIIRQGYSDLRLEGPLSIRVTFLIKRPASHYGSRKGQPYLKDDAPLYVVKPPDADKLLRSTFDALTQSGAICDDAQFVIIHAQKVYAGMNEAPGATIDIAPAH